MPLIISPLQIHRTMLLISERLTAKFQALAWRPSSVDVCGELHHLDRIGAQLSQGTITVEIKKQAPLDIPLIYGIEEVELPALFPVLPTPQYPLPRRIPQRPHTSLPNGFPFPRC